LGFAERHFAGELARRLERGGDGPQGAADQTAVGADTVDRDIVDARVALIRDSRPWSDLCRLGVGLTHRMCVSKCL
jgi:hypothetical protein